MPLSATSLVILVRRRIEVPPDEPRVFPGLTAWTDDYRALSTIHGGAYEWKDFRRTLSTRLAARGFSEEIIGRALNHARYTVTARHYIKHTYLAQALDAWDSELPDIIAGRSVGTGGVSPARRPFSLALPAELTQNPLRTAALSALSKGEGPDCRRGKA